MIEHHIEPETEAPPTRERSAFLVPVLSLAAVLALIVGIAVVVSDDDGDVAAVDAGTLLSAAPDAVREAGSARMRMLVKIGGEGTSMDIGGEGLVDFVSGAGTFSMSMMGGMTFDMRTDGTTMWMRLPQVPEMTFPGITKEWIAAPVTEFGTNTPFGVDSTAGYLEAFRGIGSEIENLGRDEVNGVQVTHYRVVVSLADAIAAAPESQRARAEAALEQFGTMGLSSMPMDVWITEDGLPIRTTLRLQPGDDAESLFGGFSMEMSFELSDFGVPVDIQPPPADQVQEIDPAQLEQLLGGGGMQEMDPAA